MPGLSGSKLKSCCWKRKNGSLFESLPSLYKQACPPFFCQNVGVGTCLLYFVCDDCTSLHYLEWNVKKKKNEHIYCSKFISVQLPFSVWCFYNRFLKFILIFGIEAKCASKRCVIFLSTGVLARDLYFWSALSAKNREAPKYAILESFPEWKISLFIF